MKVSFAFISIISIPNRIRVGERNAGHIPKNIYCIMRRKLKGNKHIVADSCLPKAIGIETHTQNRPYKKTRIALAIKYAQGFPAAIQLPKEVCSNPSIFSPVVGKCHKNFSAPIEMIQPAIKAKPPAIAVLNPV